MSETPKKRAVLQVLMYPAVRDHGQPLSVEYITVEYTVSIPQGAAEERAVKNLMSQVDWAKTPDDIEIVDVFVWTPKDIHDLLIAPLSNPKHGEFVRDNHR